MLRLVPALLYLICHLLLACSLNAQETPPISNFSPVDYGAVNQNWSITQGEDELIYIANNGGLLAFDGFRWVTYPSPNGSSMRGVASHKGRIYGGYYTEFGYWEADETGTLQYQSLVDQLPEPMLEGEEVWNIQAVGDWVLFQSLQRIYAYNPKANTFQLIPAQNTLARMFLREDVVYFQRKGAGLYRIEQGKAVAFLEDPVVKEQRLAGLFWKDGDPLLLTESGVFYRARPDGEGLYREKDWSLPDGVKVYSSIELNSGKIAVGTISSGVYLFNESGELQYNLGKSEGLNNNTILNLFEDRDANLWAALDNGISVINLNSPFREYNDPDGRMGVVYTSVVHDGLLYLGTNQGVFYKPWSEARKFEFVAGTRGQVWQLKVLQGTLFCGHNNGTFVLADGKATQISDLPGSWDFIAVPGKNELILQGNYQGLSVLERSQGQWALRNEIGGFGISSRFFEFTAQDRLLVSHEFKGIYVLGLDEDLRKASVITELPSMGVGTSLFRFGNDLLYTSDSGIFKYDPQENAFHPEESLTATFRQRGAMPVGIMMPDTSRGRLWGFSPESLDYLSRRTFDGSPQLNSVPVPAAFRRELGVLGFENISALPNGEYLIGKSNGYVLFNPSREQPADPELIFRRVQRRSHDGSEYLLPLAGGRRLEYGDNNLEFQFAAPEFNKYVEVLYRYRMPGLFDTWSEWNAMPRAGFENLPYGPFKLEVQARIGRDLLPGELAYEFRILRPWYLSYLALALYALFLLAFFFLLHRGYRMYYKKKEQRLKERNERELKRKKWKAQKEVIALRNEKLQQEIASKNRELAVSTMSLIKKNEFLNKIKAELRKVKDPGEIHAVIRTIDRNINNSDDWQYFEEAFNNADKDFLRKVQDRHPQLTANDLKLCAYLRLNLSSKEIAPLLNISVRSVEVKRYRLRKKMGLPRETGLTEYILNL